LEQQDHILTDRVNRAGRGDSDAQAWLYGQYGKAMYNICVRMTGNRSDAEDTLQDAFMLAFKNLRQLRQPENFGGWLRRIVVNECIRCSKRSFHWKDLDEQHPEPAADNGTGWWAGISMELLQEEIKGLPGGG
jgi:RNA polymerase sigma factor (sigma-70 family)